MQSNAFLILAYLIGWMGLLAYIGWVTLRIRGVRTDLEAVRDLVEQRDRGGQRIITGFQVAQQRHSDVSTRKGARQHDGKPADTPAPRSAPAARTSPGRPGNPAGRRAGAPPSR